MDRPPATCANLLQCNRQIYAEMTEAIQLARRKELMSVKLDCIAEDESFHYFTWLGIPLVKTTRDEGEGKSRIILSWADRMMEKYLTGRSLSYQNTSILIHQLWVDIRLFGGRSGKWVRNSNAPDRTSWAICAALKRIFDKGPDFTRMKQTGNTIMVDELVLNVTTPPDIPEEKYLDEDFPIDGMKDGLVHPRTVAKELVHVWYKIWAAEELKGALYQSLLERIKRVRVCVNEETWGIRELRLELERGQAERRRIEARNRRR